MTIITIDGPAGSGKSTIAKHLAKELDFTYFDTGAMYRIVAYASLQAPKSQSIEETLKQLDFTVEMIDKEKHYFLKGEDISKAIRHPEVTQQASIVAAMPPVRLHLVTMQRKLGETYDSIFDGRDTGSVVFPNATLKIYLDASAEERAKRRHIELQASKSPISYEEILANINERDHRDMTREHSPLCVPDNAHVIDTSSMSIPEVAEAIKKFYLKAN
jgi:cytidylate kinase